MKMLFVYILVLLLGFSAFADDVKEKEEVEIKFNPRLRLLGVYSPTTGQVGMSTAQTGLNSRVFLLTSTNNRLYILLPKNDEAGKIEGGFQKSIGVRLPTYISVHALAGVVTKSRADFAGENTVDQAALGYETGTGFNGNFFSGRVSPAITFFRKNYIVGKSELVEDIYIMQDEDHGVRYELRVLGDDDTRLDFSLEKTHTALTEEFGLKADTELAMELEVGRFIGRLNVHNKTVMGSGNIDSSSRDTYGRSTVGGYPVNDIGAQFEAGIILGKKKDE